MKRLAAAISHVTGQEDGRRDYARERSTLLAEVSASVKEVCVSGGYRHVNVGITLTRGISLFSRGYSYSVAHMETNRLEKRSPLGDTCSVFVGRSS